MNIKIKEIRKLIFESGNDESKMEYIQLSIFLKQIKGIKVEDI